MWRSMSSHVGLGQRLSGLYRRQILYTSERMVYKFPVLLSGYIIALWKNREGEGQGGEKTERDRDRQTQRETEREGKKNFCSTSPKTTVRFDPKTTVRLDPKPQ